MCNHPSMSRRPGDQELERFSAPLRADVRRLGSVLGEVIAEAGGKDLLEDVERIRKAAIDLRAGRGDAAAGLLAVDLRNPYVDALSFLQLRFLREGRADLVRLTIGVIAAGLQNTG